MSKIVLLLSLVVSSVAAQESSGRRYKKVGAALMGTGGAVALTGTGLWIGGEASQPCVAYSTGGCTWSSLSVAGASTAAVGTALIVSGVIVYVIGGRKMDRARAP